MASKKAIEFLRGKVYWAKILGAPVSNYEGTGREWAFEFEPDEDGVKIIKNHKLGDRLKDKSSDERYAGRGVYLSLKRPELDRDGNENKHIRIYDAEDNDWDHDTLIGNGSVVDLKIDIRDYGVGKKKGIYPVAIRVQDLVSYEKSEFGKMDGDAPKAQKKVKATESVGSDFGVEDEDNLDDPLP